MQTARAWSANAPQLASEQPLTIGGRQVGGRPVGAGCGNGRPAERKRRRSPSRTGALRTPATAAAAAAASVATAASLAPAVSAVVGSLGPPMRGGGGGGGTAAESPAVDCERPLASSSEQRWSGGGGSAAAGDERRRRRRFPLLRSSRSGRTLQCRCGELLHGQRAPAMGALPGDLRRVTVGCVWGGLNDRWEGPPHVLSSLDVLTLFLSCRPSRWEAAPLQLLEGWRSWRNKREEREGPGHTATHRY